MKQRELLRGSVVKDPVRIREYLAKCRKILLGASQPQTSKGEVSWYWKKTNWNEYTLVGGRETYKFSGYPMLHKFCVANNIDATQV